MSMVYFVSMKSKDKNTHIGAVIVDDKNRILSCGYNSFPMGIDDDVPERQERPEKYYWMIHAEVGAITLAGRDLRGAKLYTQGVPCMDCARAIVQAGIKKVVVHRTWDNGNYNQWEDHAKRTVVLFGEAGVELQFYCGDIIRKISGLKNGKEI